MAGFQDVKGSRVIVFYPDGGVSESAETPDGYTEGR